LKPSISVSLAFTSRSGGNPSMAATLCTPGSAFGCSISRW
jgi:hypothetical protein